MASYRCLLILTVITVFFFSATGNDANDANWLEGHATFYGDMSGRETMMGACGYGNLFDQGYGLETTALSEALFNNGATCGACYEVKCYNDPQWCLRGSVRVTATNFCPPNYSKPYENWCNPPQKHFDLSMPMFLKIAKYKAGIVPILFKRIPCVKVGGVKFELKGNPWFLMVVVYNVAGAGDVRALSIKGSSTNWMQMSRNWGQVWDVHAQLLGQGLSFRVTTSNGRTVEADNVVPSNWQFGQHYEARVQF
ncbi:expansin-A22-like [Aristolochia californica]|uniref:expansin-A22-like n=1 Tax=Aristolochia californica TaxID=171875 RepID=UPI0035DD826F